MVRRMSTLEKDLDLVNTKKDIWDEVRRCSSCGFCEWVCPTLEEQKLRYYGPRGRINIILFLLRDAIWTRKGLESIFSCLVCDICTTQCPAGIHIAEVIKKSRYYIIKGGMINVGR
jgi:glycolate oxidase iron-sulfur subunit